MSNKKVYHLIDVCRKMIKTFPKQKHENTVFSAVFYRNGKKLNAIDQADVTNFSALIRSYDKSENPDKIKIDFKDIDRNLLFWTKTFDVDDIGEEIKQSSFHGLGEAEVNDLVNRKFSELERQKEVEYLTRDLQTQKTLCDELQSQLTELQTTLDAKKHVEYYSNIIGMALPGLAKFFIDTPAGSTLSFLAGTEEEAKALEENKKENTGDQQRTSIIRMISDFCNTLANQELGTLYLLMIELEKDKTNFASVLQYITQSPNTTTNATA